MTHNRKEKKSYLLYTWALDSRLRNGQNSRILEGFCTTCSYNWMRENMHVLCHPQCHLPSSLADHCAALRGDRTCAAVSVRFACSVYLRNFSGCARRKRFTCCRDRQIACVENSSTRLLQEAARPPRAVFRASLCRVGRMLHVPASRQRLSCGLIHAPPG